MMDTRPGLRVLACGGTFDKRYDPIAGELAFSESSLPGIVARVRLTGPTEIQTVMLIDSLDMGDAERERIVAACATAPEPSIVIVHGTDTMPETARALGPLFGNAPQDSAARELSKTIVLTGAMVPYSIAGSDALFNLGFACACAQTLAPGVWIAMNGRVFAWDAVRKNREAGVFEGTN